MTDLEKLQANARLAIETLAPLAEISQFGFNRESVAWVAGYIERQRTRADFTPELANGLTSVLGSFLGECIVRCHGGSWTWDKELGTWQIAFDPSNGAYPFANVRKQFENGAEGGDSILGFFDSIGPLFSAPQKHAPWWQFWKK